MEDYDFPDEILKNTTKEAYQAVISASRIAKANEFDEIIISRISRGMKDAMFMGFQYSLFKPGDKKYIKIVQYSKEHNFDLYVNKPLMKLLIVERRFDIIEFL